jgi:SSS family solute:Na+ symporter
LFYGTILGVFLIAFFLKNIRGNAVFYAAILSEIVVFVVYYNNLVSFLWLNVLGAFSTLILAILIQKLMKNENP